MCGLGDGLGRSGAAEEVEIGIVVVERISASADTIVIGARGERYAVTAAAGALEENAAIICGDGVLFRRAGVGQRRVNRVDRIDGTADRIRAPQRDHVAVGGGDVSKIV